MKKKILLFSLGLMISTITIAQTPVMTGNILFDPYFGIPTGNILWNNGSGDNYKVNGGQFAYGGRLEYMIADDLGIFPIFAIASHAWASISNQILYFSSTKAYTLNHFIKKLTC